MSKTETVSFNTLVSINELRHLIPLVGPTVTPVIQSEPGCGKSSLLKMLEEDLGTDDYDFIFDTNVRGAFFVAQEVGKRMLVAWADGVNGLRQQRVYAVGDWQPGEAFDGFSAPAKLKSEQAKLGRSPLLGER